jgi:hypothetical protein
VVRKKKHDREENLKIFLLIQVKVFYFISLILFLFLLWLGGFIDVKDVDEKDTILKSLKNIGVNNKEQCFAILNKYKNIIFLPTDDKNDTNIEVGNEILNLLIKVSENLFIYGDKEEFIQFQ